MIHLDGKKIELKPTYVLRRWVGRVGRVGRKGKKHPPSLPQQDRDECLPFVTGTYFPRFSRENPVVSRPWKSLSFFIHYSTGAAASLATSLFRENIPRMAEQNRAPINSWMEPSCKIFCQGLRFSVVLN